MLKNIKIKKVIKNTISPLFSGINKIVPKRDDYILLYSANHGICHSLVPLKKYLLNHSYDNNNKIICGIESMKYAESDERVKYIGKFKSILYFLISKHVFYTTGQIPVKPSRQQVVIHLRHGNANYKTSGKLTKINNGNENYFTYMIASSELYVPIMVQEFACKESQIVVAGDAMLDGLFECEKKYYFGDFSKVLLWLPTFRQSDYLGYNDTSIQDVVPLFPEEAYERLNDMLKEYDIKLIVKLHPAQNLQKNHEYIYSNLEILTHQDFQARGYELYNLMAQADGLIGDYSSASLQYLLTDKPEAFVIPDIDEYREKRGFEFENPEEYMAGHIIKTQDEFEKFIRDFANGVDCYSDKRKLVRDKVFKYQDSCNCERIVKLSGIHLE